MARLGRWLAAVAAMAAGWAGAEPRIESFAPQGEAKAVRQATIAFSEPMVAFGDPRVADPVTWKCEGDPGAARAKGRWVDATHWALDFPADLPAGVTCRFATKPDLKSVAGAALAARAFAFNTGGPAVVASAPYEGSEALDEDATFLLAFDAPVEAGSLAQHAWCEAKGVNERIPVQSLGSEAARKLLAQQPQVAYRFYRVILKGRRPVELARFRITDERFKSLPVAALKCARRLPAGAEVAVVIGEGVKSTTGIARGTAQKLAFKVRPEFSAAFRCPRVNAEAQCLPTGTMRLDFNAPIARAAAEQVRLVTARGAARAPKLDPAVKTVDSLRFEGPFPESTTWRLLVPDGLRDDAGRPLANAASFPLEVKTDRYPALLKFPARFGILEASDPVLPVTVRGIEPALAGRSAEILEGEAPVPGRAARIAGNEAQFVKRMLAFLTPPEYRPRKGEPPRPGEMPSLEATDGGKAIAVPRPLKGRATEVVGIPLGKPGFYIVELASPRLGEELHGAKKPYYVATSALVTNLAVHLKLGRENSLAWVTKLSDGSPVAGARTSLRDCNGNLLAEGRTEADGTWAIARTLPTTRYNCPHVALAQVEEDLSFTLSSWREGLEPWNFGFNSGRSEREPLVIHTVFDRTLLRAGETVSMKHVARAPVGRGMRIPKENELPGRVAIVHAGSGQKVELAVKFDASGVAESRWTIPKEGKLGTYELEWSAARKWAPRAEASFRVEAFRVPLMRATLAPPRAPLVRPTAAKLDAAVNYLSGGPASGAAVTIRHRVEPRSASFADHPEFQFNGEVVKEGVEVSSSADRYASFDAEDEAGDADSAGADSPVATKRLTLDAAGTAAITLDKLPVVDAPRSLVVEMEYNDPNGERLTAATRVALHPAALYVGLQVDDWARSRASVEARALVVDPTGRPLAHRAVSVEIFERKTYSSRRRMLGGFYAYDNVTETRRAGTGCSGTTDAKGVLRCTVKPGASGELLLRAQAMDDAKRAASATASVWIADGDEWWFDPSNTDRMDLVPEKRRYEPGETARFQARMPFREATVLVTVEREGILSHRVVKLDARSPVIEVPVEGHHGPNVFVSALAVRGRLSGAGTKPPTALVDLARPAYKLGAASIEVGRREYELKVKVTPDRETFKVRDKARVTIEATLPGGAPAAGAQVALAAVDEGLLELMDNASWKLLEGMTGTRTLEVVTATAQGHVIGKRHFGRKAVPAGGGGGRAGSRELFDTLLLWRGRVPLDAQGRASVEIPLNDSLTSFRIVAVALQGEARFGTGQATIRTTQDLILFSGLPTVVREGDTFEAMFTLRNTTAAAVAAKLAWAATDAPRGQGRGVSKGEQPVALAAGESRVVSLPVTVPLDAPQLHWDVSATVGTGARDALRVSQQVLPVHPVRVYQATLVQLDRPTAFAVERPSNAIPGRGGVRVQTLASLAGEMAPLREWFLRYPYSCLEQRTSRAIGLGDAAMFKAVGAALPSYLDRDGLARYFPGETLEGSDVLTAYLVQVADADGREWPEEALARMLGGLEAFATGRIARGSALPTADLALRKLAAIEALARHGRARPAMLEAITIDAPRWPTSALLDWIGILQRVEGIPQREAKRGEALSLLRARLNLQGTVMTFSTEKSDALWWLMAGVDVNANRALLAVLDEPSWRGDLGRLARGALSRQVAGTWSTTVANAWGRVALTRFGQAFEATPATGPTRVTLAGEKVDIAMQGAGGVASLDWPAAKATLGLAHQGEGAPWAIVQSRAALPLEAPLSTGYRIKRTVRPIEQKSRGEWSRGDTWRVTLEVDAQSDMTWVVVDDPVPAGAAILGSGLGGDSALLAGGERREGRAWPAFVERAATAYRAYYAFVPKGKFTVEYTVRLNNAGRFDLPATRVEAMYAPEMLGEAPNAPVVVKP